jgi:hypothetical protein
MGKSFVQMTKEEYWSMSHGIMWKGRLLGRAGRWRYQVRQPKAPPHRPLALRRSNKGQVTGTFCCW